MNKRERVTAAFRGEETDHVPVCMWKHVPPAYWADDDRFAEYQARAYQHTDVDFMKLSGDKYFGWPSPVLDGIEKAEDLYHLEPLGPMHPYIRGQIARTRKVVKALGKECVTLYLVFAPLSCIRLRIGYPKMMRLIRENPETRFDIFLPPYNATEWSTMKSRGSLDAMLKVRELCCDALLGLPNVHLYDFSARTDWVLNLDNYKDTTHYGEWINSAIIRSIAAEENLVTSREEFLNHSRLLSLWAELLMEARTWREDLPIE